MLNSVVCSKKSYLPLPEMGSKDSGNPLAHTILRGAVNKHGQSILNYHYEDLYRLLHMYEERELQYPAAIIDSNHANSNKTYWEQPRIIKEVLYSRKISPI